MLKTVVTLFGCYVLHAVVVMFALTPQHVLHRMKI